MDHVQTIVSGKWRENCYVVSNTSGTAIVIDAGEDTDAIQQTVRQRDLNVVAILNTHAHYDHVGSVAALRNTTGAPFCLHKGDHQLLRQANFYCSLFGGKHRIEIPTVDFDLAGHESVSFGGMTIEVIETPGHTAGSVCFLIDGLLFSGDTLLERRIGRTDLPGGDKAALRESVLRLLALPDETIIHPGHGAVHTLAELRASNLDVLDMLK